MSDKSHPFYVYSGLLAPAHRRAIGPALWVFLWCVEKTTTEQNGAGLVCGGREITREEIAQDLDEHKGTILRHLRRLEMHAYIETERGKHGLRITVWKSKRWTGRATARVSKNAHSQNSRELAEMRTLEESKVSNNAHSQPRNPLPESDLQDPQPCSTKATIKQANILPPKPVETHGEFQPVEGGSIYELEDQFREATTKTFQAIHKECAIGGLPSSKLKKQVEGLVKRHGTDRICEIAMEKADRIMGKSWNYAIKVIQTTAEEPPKPKTKMKCPNPKCFHKESLFQMVNYRNPTTPEQINRAGASYPHLQCPVCNHRVKTTPADLEELKRKVQEKKEKNANRKEKTLSLEKAMGATLSNLPVLPIIN